ncbi:hypothetical protein HHK36_024317 [Tetracentron sinense]|uniref:RanBP2-type domain-containing protein n=1 Tax=Tetracentron sinense TaxID=13715 RepID=A0A834YNQ8_TETSI|nr:hypothetical protein HHK36_024317 [Tetracentron sinense]
MDSETLQTCRMKKREAENDYHNHSDRIHCQRFYGRNENSGPDGISAIPGYEENCGEEKLSGIPSIDTAANLNGSIQPEATSKKARQQKEMTLQDMYNQQEDYDDDDDDDSDWEPLQKHVAIKKWFCINCTMVNLDDVVHCDICGEHKESGILRHGCFASNLGQEASHTQAASEIIGRYKDSCTQNSDLDNSTAIGFDERMLLHSEVEMKSHPHPERPDRLRAITASLATAGIFPGRCFSISAREITQEELQMVSYTYSVSKANESLSNLHAKLRKEQTSLQSINHVQYQVHSLEHIETVGLTSRILSSFEALLPQSSHKICIWCNVIAVWNQVKGGKTLHCAPAQCGFLVECILLLTEREKCELLRK